MKNIEWLKREIHKELESWQSVEGGIDGDGINEITLLINQLDEPEVTLDRAFEKVAESYLMTKEEIWRHLEWLEARGSKVTYKETEVLSQKLPVIPKFVADWIDAHNLHGNNPLREYRDLEIDFNEGWTDEKDAEVYHWANKNPYAFIDSLRYGYSPSLRAASINIGKAIQEGIDMVNQPSHYKGKHGLEILFEHFATKVEELEKMSGHKLYTPKDFENMSWEEQDGNFHYDCVVNGGLNVCKVCGEAESGLDKPCRPNEKEVTEMKKIYEVSVYGCDDSTTIRQELTFEEYEFLNMIAEKITNTSNYVCMPTMEIEEVTE